MTDAALDAALDEIIRLRKAIATHRDAIQNHPRADWIDGIDQALWLTLSERYRR